MSKTLKQVRAGRLVCAVVYTTAAAGDSPRARTQKQRASTAARDKLNARTSFQKLERTLAANFDNGDLFITLTYDDTHLPEDREAAIRRIRSFLSKLRKARKPRGQLLHYIYVTEGGCPGGRLHHHLVVNSTGEDLEEIRRLWIYGDNVEVRRLEFNQGHTYEDLASYLTKEPVPDYVTLTAPPEAVILQNEGPVRNGYGEFAWIKYMLPYQPDRRRARSKRRRRRKKE